MNRTNAFQILLNYKVFAHKSEILSSCTEVDDLITMKGNKSECSSLNVGDSNSLVDRKPLTREYEIRQTVIRRQMLFFIGFLAILLIASAITLSFNISFINKPMNVEKTPAKAKSTSRETFILEGNESR